MLHVGCVCVCDWGGGPAAGVGPPPCPRPPPTPALPPSPPPLSSLAPFPPVAPFQVRKFATDQYAATGINLHPGLSPAEVVKQPDGRLTVVLQDKAGARTEVKDCDQVCGG